MQQTTQTVSNFPAKTPKCHIVAVSRVCGVGGSLITFGILLTLSQTFSAISLVGRLSSAEDNDGEKRDKSGKSLKTSGEKNK